MRGDLQEGHCYAFQCQFPLFPVPIPLLPSTKTPFLCLFDLRDPRFLAFRAQNRGFCALLPEGGRPLAGDAYGKKVYIQGAMPELKARGQNCGHGARIAGTGPEMRARCQNCGHDARDAAEWGEIRRLRQCRSLACTCVVLE